MNVAQTYQKMQEQVTSQEELLIVTYKEIISKLKLIKVAIEERILDKKIEEIEKVLLGFEVLRAALDFEKGGEIAKNLDAIYAFCIDELLKANATNNTEYIDNIIEILTPILEGFQEALKVKDAA